MYLHCSGGVGISGAHIHMLELILMPLLVRKKIVISLIYKKNGDLGVDHSVVPCLCFHAVNKSERKRN